MGILDQKGMNSALHTLLGMISPIGLKTKIIFKLFP